MVCFKIEPCESGRVQRSVQKPNENRSETERCCQTPGDRKSTSRVRDDDWSSSRGNELSRGESPRIALRFAQARQQAISHMGGAVIIKPMVLGGRNVPAQNREDDSRVGIVRLGMIVEIAPLDLDLDQGGARE
jgi:hypothetical protein